MVMVSVLALQRPAVRVDLTTMIALLPTRPEHAHPRALDDTRLSFTHSALSGPAEARAAREQEQRFHERFDLGGRKVGEVERVTCGGEVREHPFDT